MALRPNCKAILVYKGIKYRLVCCGAVDGLARMVHGKKGQSPQALPTLGKTSKP